MKQITICLLIAVILVSFSACANNTQEASQPLSSANLSNTLISETDITESDDTNSSNSKIPNETQTVKMTAGENELYITIYDNPTSRDFLSKLPLTLTFEDYNATEKISYLPETLTTENAHHSFDPDVGDVALYAPWGNLSVFYKDFRYKDFRDSAGLISIGHMDDGIEILAEIDDSFTAVLELIET